MNLSFTLWILFLLQILKQVAVCSLIQRMHIKWLVSVYKCSLLQGWRCLGILRSLVVWVHFAFLSFFLSVCLGPFSSERWHQQGILLHTTGCLLLLGPSSVIPVVFATVWKSQQISSLWNTHTSRSGANDGARSRHSKSLPSWCSPWSSASCLHIMDTSKCIELPVIGWLAIHIDILLLARDLFISDRWLKSLLNQWQPDAAAQEKRVKHQTVIFTLWVIMTTY